MKKIGLLIYSLIVELIVLSPNSYSQWVQCRGLENQSVSSFAGSGRNLIAGVWGGFLYLSVDSGATWALRDTVATTWVCPDCGLVVPPSVNLFAAGSDVFEGAGNWVSASVHVSTDNGLNWTVKDTGFSISVSCFISVGDSIFVATNRGTFYSTDEGLSWITIGNKFSGQSLAKIGSTLFAATEGNGIYRSTNYGSSWTEVDSADYDFSGGLVVLGTNIFAGAFQFYHQPSTGGIFVSKDNGESWDHSDTGMTDHSVNVLYSDGLNLFAGTNTNIFVSTDTGATWKNISPQVDSQGANALIVYDSYLFTGNNGGAWRYPISQLVTGVKIPPRQTPSNSVLQQNYPNPFNPTTVISYHLAKNSLVDLVLYDMLGRKVETLLRERQSAGAHSVYFNAGGLSSGVYFYKLTAGDFVDAKKLIVIK